MRRLTLITGMLLVLGMILVACGEDELDQTPANGGAPPEPTATASPTESPSSEQPDLAGTSWVLSEFGERELVTNEPVTMRFDDGQATGNAGCNDYGASYDASTDGSISFGEIEATEMACEIGMDIESAFLDALPQVERYEVEESRLELVDGTGDTLLVFTQDAEVETSALEGTSWALVDLHGEPVPEEFDPITLNFNDGGEAGGTVCNAYGGSYEAGDDGSLSITELFQTEMYCTEPEGIMDLESEYMATLEDVASYQVESDRLLLLNESDDTLMTFARHEEEAEDPLDGTAWVVAEIDGEPIIEDTDLTMAFEDGQITGNSGCNSYGGDYTATADGEIELHDMTMTLMACADPDGVMDQESAFQEALRDVTAYEMSGDTLHLLDEAGTVRIALVAADQSDEPSGMIDLEGTTWVLTAMNDQPLESEAPYTLQFAVNGPTGKAGCMGYWMTFEPQPDGTINRTNDHTSTYDAFCEDDEASIAEAETFIDALEDTAGYAANEEHLQLLDDQGMILLEFQRGLGGGELEGTSWVLTSMNGEPPIDGTEITLDFDPQTALGNAGCNGYGGPYMVVEPGTVVFTGVDREEMGCIEPEGIMDQETEYFDTLVRVTGYVLTEDSLTLLDVDGETILTFEPQP